MLSGGDRSAHIYVCGPAGFIDFVVTQARTSGRGDDRIHSERFDADVDLGGGSFELTLAGDGRTFWVPSGRSIAQVLLDAGIYVPISCEQAFAGRA